MKTVRKCTFMLMLVDFIHLIFYWIHINILSREKTDNEQAWGQVNKTINILFFCYFKHSFSKYVEVVSLRQCSLNFLFFLLIFFQIGSVKGSKKCITSPILWCVRCGVAISIACTGKTLL